MKTPMNIYNTAMKKKKNRKGFSLVELIVVLVIMAILAAALIPSLIGYISKTKEQNVQSECQQAVTAAQTIASGLYASADGKYTFSPAGGGDSITVDDSTTKNIVTTMGNAKDAVKKLAEVPGTVVTIEVSNDGLVTKLVYAEGDGATGKKQCTYTRANATAAGTYTNGKVA